MYVCIYTNKHCIFKCDVKWYNVITIIIVNEVWLNRALNINIAALNGDVSTIN